MIAAQGTDAFAGCGSCGTYVGRVLAIRPLIFCDAPSISLTVNYRRHQSLSTAAQLAFGLRSPTPNPGYAKKKKITAPIVYKLKGDVEGFPNKTPYRIFCTTPLNASLPS